MPRACDKEEPEGSFHEFRLSTDPSQFFHSEDVDFSVHIE